MKLAIFDTSKAAGSVRHAWPIGAGILKARGKLTHVGGFKDLADALQWSTGAGTGVVDQLEIWCHGFPGGIKWGEQYYQGTLPMLDQVARAMAPGGVVWFRACRVFHGDKGIRFAGEAAGALRCLVAGHTYDIGPLQSGLHTMDPDERIAWPADEGGAKPSRPWHPNTIHCLQNDIPGGF